MSPIAQQLMQVSRGFKSGRLTAEQRTQLKDGLMMPGCDTPTGATLANVFSPPHAGNGGLSPGTVDSFLRLTSPAMKKSKGGLSGNHPDLTISMAVESGLSPLNSAGTDGGSNLLRNTPRWMRQASLPRALGRGILPILPR